MYQASMQIHPSARVTLSINAQNTLFQDICQRQHIEACGLLLGHLDNCGKWQINEAYPLRNIYNSPVYFEFAPEDLLAVDEDHPGQVIGVYHSHPTGLAAASSTDRENMQRVNIEQQIPWVWLIVSGPFNETFQLQQWQQARSSVIAYHHYADIGLQQITIEFEEFS